MRLRRAPNPHGWTSIPNAALEDRQLSFRARGVLAYLLSRPEGWETDSVRLSKMAGLPGDQRSSRAEGRDAVRTSLSELEAAGYLHRVRVRRPAGMTLDGRHVGGQVSIEYYISDHPVPHPGELEHRVPELDELPAPPADEGAWTAGAWQSGAGDDAGDNAGENLGTSDTPAPGKPAPENPAPLTSDLYPENSSSQGDPPLGSAASVENGAAQSAALPSAPLAALASSGSPFGEAVLSTDAIMSCSRLEPGVQMFALRAHLVRVLGYQPAFTEVASWVERAHESAPPSRRGRLSSGAVAAYAQALSSPPEPIPSGLEAAAPSGGLTAALPASRPAADDEVTGRKVPAPVTNASR